MTSADRREGIASSANWIRGLNRNYAFALAGVLLAGAIRYRLDVALGFTQPFVLFYPVITLIALLGGFGPALFATVLSAGVAAYFLMEPLNSFKVEKPRDLVGLLLFIAMGIVISAIGDQFRRRAQRLQEFEKAVEGLEEMIVVVDRDYRYLIANRAFLNYRGMKSEAVIGRLIAEILSPEVFGSIVKDKLDACFRGEVVQFETRVTYPTRGERELFITYFPIEGRKCVERVAAVLQDVTDQRKSERALNLFRTLIDQSNDVVEVVDPETLRLLDVNGKACEALGYSREELLKMTVYDIDANSDESAVASDLARLRERGAILKETIHRRKDGFVFPVETSLKYARLDRDYIIAVSRDISYRKRAEEALLLSEDRYRDLVEHCEDLVCTHDLDGNLLSLNPAPARILRYEVAELLRIPMRELLAPESREGFDAYLKKIEATGSDEGELCVVARNGERRIWEYKNTLRTRGVTFPVVRGMARDVTERRRAEKALRTREEDYRQFVAQSSEGIFREDMDAPVSIDLPEDELVYHIMHDSYLAECNQAMARMYGLESVEDLTGKRLTEMLIADDPRNIELTREYIRSGFRVIERESRETDTSRKSKSLSQQHDRYRRRQEIGSYLGHPARRYGAGETGRSSQ